MPKTDNVTVINAVFCTIALISFLEYKFVNSVSIQLKPKIKLNETAMRLNRFNTANFENRVLDGVLNNVNAYLFEYKKGSRIIGDEIIFIDTKSWKYPKQDASIVIDFPHDATNNSFYFMTSFRVFICQDSSGSEGYITNGGPGTASMGLKFTAKKSKYISYDIRLYGIHSDLVFNSTELFQKVNVDTDD